MTGNEINAYLVLLKAHLPRWESRPTMFQYMQTAPYQNGPGLTIIATPWSFCLCTKLYRVGTPQQKVIRRYGHFNHLHCPSPSQLHRSPPFPVRRLSLITAPTGQHPLYWELAVVDSRPAQEERRRNLAVPNQYHINKRNVYRGVSSSAPGCVRYWLYSRRRWCGRRCRTCDIVWNHEEDKVIPQGSEPLEQAQRGGRALTKGFTVYIEEIRARRQLNFTKSQLHDIYKLMDRHSKKDNRVVDDNHVLGILKIQQVSVQRLEIILLSQNFDPLFQTWTQHDRQTAARNQQLIRVNEQLDQLKEKWPLIRIGIHKTKAGLELRLTLRVRHWIYSRWRWCKGCCRTCGVV